jgi:hypothetical protein
MCDVSIDDVMGSPLCESTMIQKNAFRNNMVHLLARTCGQH